MCLLFVQGLLRKTNQIDDPFRGQIDSPFCGLVLGRAGARALRAGFWLLVAGLDLGWGWGGPALGWGWAVADPELG